MKPAERHDLWRRRFTPAGERSRERGEHFAVSPLRRSKLFHVWNEKPRAQLDARFAPASDLTCDDVRYILDPADAHGPDFPGEIFRLLKEK